MGLEEWRRQTLIEEYQKILDALLNAEAGLTREEIYKKTGLSRPTIDKCLLFLKEKKAVIPEGTNQYGRKYYHKSKYIAKLEDEIRKNNILILKLKDFELRQKQDNRKIEMLTKMLQDH